uniref:Large ribosomal subunit protein bL21m n=1 Tax=Aceria tosichella TaxID=561515 RepID=A0A6G1SHC3_9ACAR
MAALAQKLEQLAKRRLFAVIHMFGKQRLVTNGDLFMVDHHLPLECGEKLLINKCLVLGGKDFSIIGRPLIDKDLFRINATVVEKTMTDHKCSYRHVPRDGGNQKFLFQARPRTVLRINEIELKSLPEC